ncbi:PIN domain-containing protein [Scytonema sp. UIC 10036]|uniref:PIN domain-containing protein n=1 Tax=Scytonema sp. UIC 10036 TaxID=2304196 RepID=UPI00325B9950
MRAEFFIAQLPILPLTNSAVKRYGELKSELRRLGQPVGDFDLLIASVALTGNYILVTNNTRHYDRITQLQLENWFLPSG